MVPKVGLLARRGVRPLGMHDVEPGDHEARARADSGGQQFLRGDRDRRGGLRHRHIEARLQEVTCCFGRRHADDRDGRDRRGQAGQRGRSRSRDPGVLDGGLRIPAGFLRDLPGVSGRWCRELDKPTRCRADIVDGNLHGLQQAHHSPTVFAAGMLTHQTVGLSSQILR